MTLLCVLCSKRSDPTNNPKMIGWVCVHCLHTKQFDEMSDKTLKKMIREVTIMNKAILLLAVIPLMLVPLIANASSQSTFDNKFKKCFDAAPAPDYIKAGLPLKMWEALYKDYVGNLTMGKDVFANLSMSINIAKQVDLCMGG